MSRVFLVEPYFSGSHGAWAEGYRRHSGHEVYLLKLPGRFWKWRMFGGSLTLARQAADLVAEVGRPDVLLVSDMLDLSAFLGHASPNIGQPKTVLYMHENQLTYPLSPTARDDLAYAYMNWSSMVRADEVYFNSRFHLESVYRALPGFLRHFPDHRHTGLIDAVGEKSSVMHVGVDLSWVETTEKQEPPLIIWNQRWEYDKDPVRLFEALYRLADGGAGFRLALCGENFRNVPDEFEAAKTVLAAHIIHYGFAEREEYRRLLLDSSVVISTAKHEFFGVGAVEAMAAGAVPVFPRGLSYPELVPEQVHGDTLYESSTQMDRLLEATVVDEKRRTGIRPLTTQAMRRFSWKETAPMYDRHIAG